MQGSPITFKARLVLKRSRRRPVPAGECSAALRAGGRAHLSKPGVPLRAHRRRRREQQWAWSSPVRLGTPEATERPPIRALAQLLERPLPYLANAFAGDAHKLADPLERHGLRAFDEAVVERKNLALARREILPEYTLDELAHQLVVGPLFDLHAVRAGEALTEGRGFAVGAVDRRIQRHLGRRHLLCCADLLGSLVEQPADLVFGGIALENLGQDRLGAREPDQLRGLIQRD